MNKPTEQFDADAFRAFRRSADIAKDGESAADALKRVRDAMPLGSWHQAFNGPENQLLSDAEIGSELSKLRNNPAARRQLAECLKAMPDMRRAERRRRLLRLVMCAAIIAVAVLWVVWE